MRKANLAAIICCLTILVSFESFAQTSSEEDQSNPWEGLTVGWYTKTGKRERPYIQYTCPTTGAVLTFHILSPDSDELLLLDPSLDSLYPDSFDPFTMSSYNKEEYIVPGTILYNGREFVVKEIFFCWSHSKLRKLKLPDTIESTIAQLCEYCENLEEVDLGNSLRRLGAGAFRHTPKLRTIKFPEPLHYIENDAFTNCGLERVEFNTQLMSLGPDCFKDCPNLREVILPYSLRHIDTNSFMNCPLLEKIVIKTPFDTPINNCFNECPSIREIHFSSKHPADLNNCFNKIDKENCIVYVPVGTLSSYIDKYRNIFNWQNIYEEGSGPAAVEMPAVEAPEAQEEIYTLDGLRVEGDEQTHGILIKRKGSVTSKVIK